MKIEKYIYILFFWNLWNSMFFWLRVYMYLVLLNLMLRFHHSVIVCLWIWCLCSQFSKQVVARFWNMLGGAFWRDLWDLELKSGPRCLGFLGSSFWGFVGLSFWWIAGLSFWGFVGLSFWGFVGLSFWGFAGLNSSKTMGLISLCW